MIIREFTKDDIKQMTEIWNSVVEDGEAFPQTELLDNESGMRFFSEQTRTAVADEDGEILGLYVLHPNNVGRCGHISNASYAVKKNLRGRHIGEKLVSDCLVAAKKAGFRILQFNAVVATNASALHLYKKLGFVSMTAIPGGFLKKDGSYEDIIPHYHLL